MRYLLTLAFVGGLASVARPEDRSRQVAEALLEIHENGRTIYNNNDDYTGAYRLYQGGLMVARKMLADRPDLQKLITDGLSAADRQPTMDRRAYKLHELIETVRNELGKSAGKSNDHLTIPPRVIGGGTKPGPGPKPGATVTEVKDGVVGRVLWQGAAVGGVDVTFVTLGMQPPRVYETTTSAQGVYSIPNLPAGKYVILITPGAGAMVKKLPERYATSTTSPLIFDVKASGEKLDFVLQ
jgi:hypothetical protein